MAFKRIMPIKKRSSRATPNEAYISITPKMLYISAAAWKLLRAEYITIGIDTKALLVRIYSAKQGDEGAFKLSHVKETQHARRIETNNALLSFIRYGLPQSMLGKHLPCYLSLDGALLADYAYHPAPAISREQAAERGGDSA